MGPGGWAGEEGADDYGDGRARTDDVCPKPLLLRKEATIEEERRGEEEEDGRRRK